MIISEVKFAAAMEVSVDGHPEVLKFDDIGDMLVYERKNPQLQVRRRWVADLDRREIEQVIAYMRKHRSDHSLAEHQIDIVEEVFMKCL